MNNLITNLKIIEKFQEDMKGVFTLSDLKELLPCKHLNTFYRNVARLEKNGVINRFAREIYVTKRFDLSVVSQKICPSSYISFENVLATNLVIGTVPKHQIKAVKIGKRREYKSLLGNVLHLGIARHLYFGFETIDGVNFADKEKALLDILYFYCKGERFFFDIYSDVNVTLLDIKKMNAYLKRYKNPKFVEFVRGYEASFS